MTTDITGLIGATDRSVSSTERDGQVVRVVKASRRYDTTQDDLWNALTDRDRIPRWFLPITGDLRLGGHYQLEGNAGGEITDCDPPRRLGLTWGMAGQVSWVTVSLEPDEAGGTRLTLEHIAPVPDEMWDQFGPGAVGIGWDLVLTAGLRMHLDSGAAVEPGAAAAWMASEEGRAFLSASSDGWRDASVAAGTDEAAAAAAGERVTAFYTGGDPATG